MNEYRRLSKFYDKDWGHFSLGYLAVIDEVVGDERGNGLSVLDIGCGTGDLLCALDSKGYKGFGFDQAKEMINVAKIKGKNVDLSIADIHDFHYDQFFDIIICSFDVINYVSPVQLKEVFVNITKHLNGEGYFIFDFNTVELYKTKHSGTIKRKFGEEEYKQILKYDEKSKVATTVFEFKDGFKEKHTQYAYTYEEIKAAITSSGMEIVQKYQNLILEEYCGNGYKVFLVAKKVIVNELTTSNKVSS